MPRVIVLMLALFFFTLPGQAQAPNWLTWVYNSDTAEMFQVDSNGTQLNYINLPSVMAHDVLSRTVSVSPDGNRIAYSVYSTVMQTTQFLVYDVPTASFKVTYTPPNPILGDTFSLWQPHAFNESGNAVAYGYIVDYDPPGNWEIVVIDVATNTVLATLRGLDPVMLAARPDPAFILPHISDYTGGSITFTAVNYGTEGSPIYDAYRWSLVTNAVTTTASFVTSNASQFEPTGEILMTMPDDSFPKSAVQFEFGWQSNTLQVFDPGSATRFTVFSEQNWSLEAPRFIKNGQNVLIKVTEMTPTFPDFWAILDRSGTVLSTFTIASAGYDATGTTGGFIYSAYETRSDGLDYTFINEVDADLPSVGTRIWSAPVPGNNFRIVWVNNLSAPPPAFGGWRMLGSASGAPTPVFEGGPFPPGGGVVTPTPFAGTGILTAGGIAYIRTTEGDMLNIRSGPGTSFQRVAQAPNGMKVTLIEGPRPGDGFTWWRVRLPSGVEGWVVQRADDIDTLIPAN